MTWILGEKDRSTLTFVSWLSFESVEDEEFEVYFILELIDFTTRLLTYGLHICLPTCNIISRAYFGGEFEQQQSCFGDRIRKFFVFCGTAALQLTTWPILSASYH